MIEIIPAIDIIGGHCVRLSEGDYSRKTTYSDSPAEIARQYEAMGFKRLHVVDLDGAKSKHIVNGDTLKRITSETRLTVDFGGGIKSGGDVREAFGSGASMITLGSVAVTDKQFTDKILGEYGADRIILGADVRNGKISVNGWTEDSGIDLMDFLKEYTERGVKNVLCTDISKDGMLSGPAIELYTKIMDKFPGINLIASGGISCADDILKLGKAGIPSVVVGKAFYEGRITESELKEKGLL